MRTDRRAPLPRFEYFKGDQFLRDELGVGHKIQARNYRAFNSSAAPHLLALE